MPGIIEAVREQDIIKVREFIAAGEDVNEWRGFPLVLAAKLGSTDIASVLLAAGANPNVSHQISIHHLCSVTPLCYAVSNLNYMMINLLLDHGADITLCNPTLHAVEMGNAIIVEKFLSKIDMSAVDPAKFKLKIFLKTAVTHGHLAVAELLLNAACDLTDQKYCAMLLSLAGSNKPMRNLLERKILNVQKVAEHRMDLAN